MKLPLLLASTLALLGTASTQGSGFNAGDLFLYGHTLTTPGYNGAGILRVDPLAGTGSMLIPTHSSMDDVGIIAFDSYRQRLVFCAAITGLEPTPLLHLWLADGFGNKQMLGEGLFPANTQFRSIAPTEDGRIYLTPTSDQTQPIRWFDAANGLHTLYDTDGVTPLLIDGSPFFPIMGMIHDAATNSLFIASSTPAPGFPLGATNVRKLQLSADGGRIIAPVGNSTFEISPKPWGQTSGETPRGWARGPNGELLLLLLCIDEESLPRIVQVDPVTSVISIWAHNGSTSLPFGCSTNTAIAYSSTLGKAVITDYWNGKLRGYAEGDVGAGTVVGTSPATLGGYYSNLTAVPPDDCSGGWIAYGTGLAGKGSFVPQLAGSGCAEPGAGIGLKLSGAVGGASATLFVGLTPAAIPFKGGSFLVGGVVLTAGLPMGGTPGAAGAGSLTLPATLPAIPALSGTSLYLQAGFGDAAAVKGVSLTQGLQMAIG
jgi:hypothetical protein